MSNVISFSDFTGRKVALQGKGLCPLHAEPTLSFTVNDIRGFFRCYGCGGAECLAAYERSATIGGQP